MIVSRVLMFWSLVVALILPLGATAQTTTTSAAPAPDVYVPPELQPWVGWVLHDEKELACPLVSGVRHCIWPGDLAVDVQDDGATFAMQVWTDRPVEVQLPGNAEFWPQGVRTESGALVVLANRGEPSVKLPAGASLVRGSFDWKERPEVIRIPSDIGRVSLKISGEELGFPRIEGANLFLGEATAEAGESDSARVSVYRQFYDGVPIRVVTRLKLSIAGRAREVDLGQVQLDGSIPIRVESELPTRVGTDGTVSVYVRPGTHIIDVTAVIPKTVESLKVPRPGPEYFDPQEVWVWIPDETVRSVQLSGLADVDPERTSLPAEWRGNSTYLADPEAVLTFNELRRGLPERAPNLIQLNRELWLDLDGRGYTVRDRLTGQLNQGWRLNYGPGAKLGRVSTGSGDDLLITDISVSELSGVEVRERELDLTAELRLDKGVYDLDAVGWNHDVQSLRARLFLPPGWTILGGRDVDEIPAAWVETWTLWDFFFVLMIALAIGRLFGWGWVPVAVMALTLAHGNNDAPQWVWIHLIASLALLRVVPNGFWRKMIVVYRAVAVISLVVILAPYARTEIREALHPQVGQPQYHGGSGDSFGGFAKSEPMMEQNMPAAAPMEDMEEEPEMDFAIERKMKRKLAPMKKGDWAGSSQSGYRQSKMQLQQVDPNAVVQTGPGLPSWNWQSVDLIWVGPVRKDQRMHLWLIPPTYNMLIGFARVILLILLALLMLAPQEMYWDKPRKLGPLWSRFFGIALASIVAGSVTIPSAHAQPMEEMPQVQQVQNMDRNLNVIGTPDNPVLQDLKRRLVESESCDPCVVVSRADVRVRGNKITISAEVHAEKTSGWHLPGPISNMSLESVSVDGVVSNKLRRGKDGLTALRLLPGRHIVKVTGILANKNVLTIQFDPDNRPHFLTFDSVEWSVDGINPTGVPDASLQLTRKVDDTGEEAPVLDSELPPWFFVTRTFQLGLPWQLTTRVTRTDSDRPQLTKLPMMKDEKVISESVRVEDGVALVDFQRGVDTVEFVSEIPIQESLAIVAAENQPWSETWVVECTRIWRCEFDGIPPVEDVNGGVYRPTWKPWPGESLKVGVKRPAGTPGQASTVDSVHYEMTPGARLMRAKLTLKIRASQGGRQDIKIPAEAELQKVLIDGVEKSIRPTDSVVGLPFQPGSQTYELHWQQPWERRAVETLPQIDIGSAAVNTNLQINLGSDRWLVWAMGPKWGPDVLFWSHLAVLLILGFFLGRIRDLPIRTWEWLLLVIGLSQIPIVAGIPIVFWFVALSWRRREPLEKWWSFNLMQLCTIVLTFMALGALYGAIHTNLLFDVDMQVEGAGSSNNALLWYVDQTAGPLPTAGIVSVPILVWRITMLLWAFWLVSRLLKWARWGWESFSSGGFWKPVPPRPNKKLKQPVPAPAASAAAVPAPAVTVKPAPAPAGKSEVGPSTKKQKPSRKSEVTQPGLPRPDEEPKRTERLDSGSLPVVPPPVEEPSEVSEATDTNDES